MSDNDRDQKTPQSFDELFPGRFLKAGLLQGRKITLTITRVYTEPFPDKNGKPKRRGVLQFEQTDMELALCRTNGECVKALLGTAVQKWVGHKVTFAPEKVQFGPGEVDAIRVWGSPELKEDRQIEFQLSMPNGRVRTVRRTLHALRKDTS